MKIKKYFTKTLLIEYNNAAIRENRNRQLKEDFLETLDKDGIYLIVYDMIHNTVNEVRVQIMFDSKLFGFLDMSYERYNLLPNITFYDDNTFELQTEEDARKKFPYNGREWVEKTIRKPYRQQNKFRKKVKSTVPRFRVYRHVIPKNSSEKNVADVYELSMKESFICYYYK